ncbi:MAG: RNB domain-containing ribonuclease [Beutenbergiaceae bacterium]
MPRRNLRLAPASVADLAPALERLRTELDVPQEFSPAAQQEARAAVQAMAWPTRDATDIEFVTIDPPEAMDLDQALALSRDGDGYLIHYAIADPAAFVTPGGALDQEIHRRGMTYYGPDRREGLHPPVLAEAAASLLPGQMRPACLWQIKLDASGEIVDAVVERARVRSRAKLSYQQVQRHLDEGTSGMLGLLAVIGELRRRCERDRGGVSLAIPEQEVVRDGGQYRLEYRSTLAVEDWNAQISLTTGIAAAALMRRARIGVFRTLPTADQRDVQRLRRAAHGLGLQWGPDEDYAAVLRRLDAAVPAHAAFLEEATTLFRGADYLTFDGDLPPASPHGAIAAEYAHVTAPLRRLVDRYGLEICLSASAGTAVPSWVRSGLAQLPDLMTAAGRATNSYQRECVNLMEAAILAPRVGEAFPGVVVEASSGDSTMRGTVVIADPAVRAKVTGVDLPVGERDLVQLAQADVERRLVTFSHPASSGRVAEGKR